MCGAPARTRNEEGPDDCVSLSSSESSEVEWEDVETEDEDDGGDDGDDAKRENDTTKEDEEEDGDDSECEIVKDDVDDDVIIVDDTEKDVKKKKKNKRRITREERNKIKGLHYAELLCRLARVHLVNRALESDALRCLALSAAPRGLVEGILERPGKKEGKPVVMVMLHFAVKFFQDSVLNNTARASSSRRRTISSFDADEGRSPFIIGAKEARANKAGFAGGVAWKLSEMLRKNDENGISEARNTRIHSSFSNVSEMKAALLCVFLRALGIRARL